MTTTTFGSPGTCRAEDLGILVRLGACSLKRLELSAGFLGGQSTGMISGNVLIQSDRLTHIHILVGRRSLQKTSWRVFVGG
jgi:hypothetical protein